MNLPSDLQRLLPYVVVALLAIAGLVLVVRGVGGGGSGSATKAQQIVREAAGNSPNSGVIEVNFSGGSRVEANGRTRAQRNTLRGGGPFVEPTSDDPYALGQNDFTTRETDNGNRVVIRELSAGERGYLRVQGQWYELTQGQARRVFNDEDTGRRSSSLTEAGIDLEKWIQSPRLEGTARVGGVETDRIVGALDVDEMLSSFDDEGENSAADPFYRDARKQGEVELFVGKQDGILRKASVRSEIVPQVPNGTANIAFRVDLAFSEVGQPQKITAPKNALPPGRIKEVPRSELGETADAIYPPRKGAGGGRSGQGGAQGNEGRTGSRRSSDAYVNCVQQAADTAALEKCQALVP